MMRNRRCLLVGIALFGLAVACPAADDAKTELEGTWELVSFEREGKPVAFQGTSRSTITGNKFVFMRDGMLVTAGTFKLDPTAKPKAMDSTYTEGPDKGKSFKGIYELKGDSLRFCRPGSPDDPRPTAFKSEAGSTAFVSVFKRVKE